MNQLEVSNKPAFLEVGFRPFFLGASAFAIVSIAIWVLIYLDGINLSTAPLSILQWHAHEMIYGYALAVIAGFLLTAVENWTGRPTSRGASLLWMFLLWCAARVLYLPGVSYPAVAGILDLLFLSLLAFFLVRPVVSNRQWSHMAVLGKLVLLLGFSVVYWLGVIGKLDNGVNLGIYGGLLLVISLVLTIGRKVIPFFIERGVGYPVTLRNSKVLDLSSLILFVGFFVLELGGFRGMLQGYVALALFAVNTARLWGWHTPGIWNKPLLWGLYFAYCFICLGFLLFFCAAVFSVSRFIAIHALAFGGIGVITMSMMARVALGHTGRSVGAPPRAVSWMLMVLIAGAGLRVIPPLIDSGHYSLWIGLSALLWIVAFSLFLRTYAPMLIQRRADSARTSPEVNPFTTPDKK